MKQTLPLLAACALLFSCGSDSAQNNSNDSTAGTVTSTSNESNVTSVSSCCFQSEEQFAQFLPATCGDVNEQKAGYSANLLCNNDPSDFNQVTKIYVGADGKTLSLQIRDYCAQPANLSTDYEKRMTDSKNDPVAHTFEEVQISGAEKCYAHYSTPNKTVYVLATVDGRFRVQITGQDAASVDNALVLLRGLPLTELAKFGK